MFLKDKVFIHLKFESIVFDPCHYFIFGIKKNEGVSYLVIVHVFQKRLYDFQKRLCVFKDYIIVHPISSDAGCDGVAKDELYSSDSFLNKN